MSVVGVDGCSSGWVAVVLRTTGRPQLIHLPTIDALTHAVPDAEVIGIDIPLHIPDTGRRDAEIAAREFLGARRSSIFFTPVRAAIEAATHAEATALAVQAGEPGVSRQSYALARKILEVEAWRRSAPCPTYEVHPELSFAVLLGGPAQASKKTWAGMVERQRALDAAGISLDDVDATAGAHAAVDDVLDAAVAAWSAQRIADGTARAFPAPGEHAIWA